MAWNYRITKETIHHKYLSEPEIIYGIREVFYDKEGNINGWSEEPDIISDSVEGMKDILQKMIECCNKPVIDYNTGETIQDPN